MTTAPKARYYTGPLSYSEEQDIDRLGRQELDELRKLAWDMARRGQHDVPSLTWGNYLVAEWIVRWRRAYREAEGR